jgi:hypothetical protein
MAAGGLAVFAAVLYLAVFSGKSEPEQTAPAKSDTTVATATERPRLDTSRTVKPVWDRNTEAAKATATATALEKRAQLDFLPAGPLKDALAPDPNDPPRPGFKSPLQLRAFTPEIIQEQREQQEALMGRRMTEDEADRFTKAMTKLRLGTSQAGVERVPGMRASQAQSTCKSAAALDRYAKATDVERARIRQRCEQLGVTLPQ